MKTDNGCPNYLSNNSAKQLAERTGRNVEIGLMDIEGQPLDIFVVLDGVGIRSVCRKCVIASFSFSYFLVEGAEDVYIIILIRDF